MRRKYAPGTETILRGSVFFATTNKSPLTDNTGSTRFVMIPAGDEKLPVQRIDEARDSIWARALMLTSSASRSRTSWRSV